jgi:hypothetical protein
MESAVNRTVTAICAIADRRSCREYAGWVIFK